MRQTENFVYFTKREERAIFECYYEALKIARMDGHRRNLELVREFLIDGDGTLTVKVFDYFLNTIAQLGIDVTPMERSLKEHPNDPGKGACYRIPNKKKDRMGHTKAMATRRRWRDGFKELFGSEANHTVVGTFQRLRALSTEGLTEDQLRELEEKEQAWLDEIKSRRALRVIDGGVQ